MKKRYFSAIVSLFVLAQIAPVVAQTPEADGPNLLGTLFGAVALVAVFAFIAYAGYRIVKKWSRTTED